MIIDAISNGIVIDHISAGKAMELYNILGLDKLDCSVALLKNVSSGKLGRKDIIKIDQVLDLDWDVIGYVDPGITVNIIKDGERIEKRQLKLPERITNVIRCKNPRCITSVEQELPQVFTLTEESTRTYRCLYCETKAENSKKPKKREHYAGDLCRAYHENLGASLYGDPMKTKRDFTFKFQADDNFLMAVLPS